MKGYKANIEELVSQNTNFRKVLYTTKHTQLVLMTLKPGEEIGVETHTENDQFFRFEEGEGKAIVDRNEYQLVGGDVLIVPSGAEHNIVNTSQTAQLKLYTLYSPPHHRDGVVHQTKQQAQSDSEEFDGKTTE
jgi:mannose-6-phosphate isomerase-like protein (cupin superfamily)